eukprot:755954-Hanusia_phi.AAC.1
MPSNYVSSELSLLSPSSPPPQVLAEADRGTAASSYGAGRDTIYSTADARRTTVGGMGERYTGADRSTEHGGRSTLYFKQADM